jgi:hypothetical protein
MRGQAAGYLTYTLRTGKKKRVLIGTCKAAFGSRKESPIFFWMSQVGMSQVRMTLAGWSISRASAWGSFS